MSRLTITVLAAILSLAYLPDKILLFLSVSQKEVEQLTGNLPDLTRWQQTFLKELEDCSRLPVTKQNMGAVFLSRAREVGSHFSHLPDFKHFHTMSGDFVFLNLLAHACGFPLFLVAGQSGSLKFCCFFFFVLQIEGLYCTYCANHPKAVAVLTENS